LEGGRDGRTETTSNTPGAHCWPFAKVRFRALYSRDLSRAISSIAQDD
jgi:hypothetical protein